MTSPRRAADDLERATQALGRTILERVGAAEGQLSDVAWWEEQILEWAMSHPDLKVELFRFIDVLPSLRPRDVAPHLAAYLGHARDDLPTLLRWGSRVLPQRGPMARLVARAARQNVTRMARRFIAGSTPGEAVAAIRSLRRRRLAVTLDVLGEAVVTEEEADAYLHAYLELIQGASRRVQSLPEEPLVDRDHDGRRLPRVNVSLKLSALCAAFDPLDAAGVRRAVVPRLRRVLEVARDHGAYVHVDMEHYAYKDLTLELFKEVLGAAPFADFADVGIVIQAYLRDAERDIAELAAWADARGTPVWVRVVKGAYWDHETVIAAQRGWPVPVWTEKWQSDVCFERCTELLLDHHRVLRPAFGSHNVRSLARAVASARARHLPERFVEIQTLYGMADSVKHAFVDQGQRVRVYTPYGQLVPGMAYLVRRLLENTSNESFVRHQVVEGQSAETLLAPPEPPERGASETAMTRTNPTDDAFRNEPWKDFSLASERDAVRAAFERVRGGLPRDVPMVIGGEPVRSDASIVSVSPSDTSLVVAKVASASAEHVDRAVEVALGSFGAWRARPATDRADLMDAAAEQLGKRRDELIALVALEAGKPWRDADGDVTEAMDFCRYYAASMRRLAEPRHLRLPGEDDVTVWQPRGVTAVIAPWNFPIAILCGMTSAALVTGNTVVMKPAEQTPATASALHRCFLDAGVPGSVLQLVPGLGEVAGQSLVEHPDTATIVFTGSREVGRLIAERALATSTGPAGFKRVILEMGGKNAIVVDDDADLDEAVPGVLASAFGYAGQKCSACSRVIVVGGAYDTFVARLISAAESLVVGPADAPATVVGPLVDRASVERVARYRALAAEEGRVVFEATLGDGLAERGFYSAPTIVADLPPDSRVLREEIFGPLLAVVRAADFDDALRLANATDYALTGGVYSRSPAHIDAARARFDVGNLYINRKITGALVSRQPFGGHRYSGVGQKAGGPDYLRQFMTARCIAENTLRRGFAPE